MAHAVQGTPGERQMDELSNCDAGCIGERVIVGEVGQLQRESLQHGEYGVGW